MTLILNQLDEFKNVENLKRLNDKCDIVCCDCVEGILNVTKKVVCRKKRKETINSN